MGTAIDRLERAEEASANYAAYVERLSDALSPDPREWEYRGECAEGDPSKDRCACGHPIRFLFLVHRDRDGATKILGSTCVDAYSHIRPDMAEALRASLKRLQDAVKEAARKAREAAQDEQIRRLAEEHAEALRPLAETAAAIRAGGRWIPDAQYSFVCQVAWLSVRPPRYQRRHSYLRWYRDAIAQVRRAAEEHAETVRRHRPGPATARTA